MNIYSSKLQIPQTVLYIVCRDIHFTHVNIAVFSIWICTQIFFGHAWFFPHVLCLNLNDQEFKAGNVLEKIDCLPFETNFVWWRFLHLIFVPKYQPFIYSHFSGQFVCEKMERRERWSSFTTLNGLVTQTLSVMLCWNSEEGWDRSWICIRRHRMDLSLFIASKTIDWLITVRW